MHIALWTTGLAALACFGSAVALTLRPKKNAYDVAVASFLSVHLGIACAFSACLWLALVVLKVASA